MNKPTLSDVLHPAMLALMDEFVAGYQALRAGVTLEQQRAALDTNPAVKASYDRKMLRVAALLAGPGGFSLTKKAHAVPVAPPAAVPDVSALLAGLGKPQAPGAQA